MKASRASHMIFHGPIPEGLHVLHRCNNARCVNPDHLYAGTHMQNMRDRDESGRTSRGEHRYNFKRNSDLLSVLINGIAAGKMIETVCEEAQIGRSTFFRARKQSKELRDLMAASKHDRRVAFNAIKRGSG